MHLVILGMVYISHSWWFLGWFIVGFTTIAVMAPVNRCWCEEWPNKSWGNWMKLNHSKKSLIQSYIIVVTEWNLVPWLSEGFLKLAAMCGRNPCSFRNSKDLLIGVTTQAARRRTTWETNEKPQNFQSMGESGSVPKRLRTKTVRDEDPSG